MIPKAAAPLRSKVLDELRQSIIAGRLVPGARLVERELTGMMGVSRTVIREALRQLETEGLVAMIPNKGPVVRELTLDEARDLYAIRAVLEGLAARLFVENADQAHREKLSAALDSIERAYTGGDPETILDAKNSFYDALFDGAASPTLSAMIGMLHGRIRRWRSLGLSHPKRSAERSSESMLNLRALLVAVQGKDAHRAETILRAEVTKASAEITRILGEEANFSSVSGRIAIAGRNRSRAGAS